MLLAAACGRPESPQQTYQRLWEMYVSGNLLRTIQSVSREANRWKDRPNTIWFWKFHLLHAEALLGQSRYDEAAALLRKPVPPLPALAQMAFRRQADLANACIYSDPRRANELLDQAAAGATDPDIQLRIHLIRGGGLLAREKFNPAAAEFRTVLAQATATGNTYREAMALNNLSRCARYTNQYENAVAFAMQALDKAGGAHAGFVQAQAHGNLANYYIYLGNTGAALEHVQQAIKLFEAAGAQLDLMTDLNLLGLVRDAQGDVSAAIQSYQRAYKIALQSGERNEAARYAANLSLVLIKDRQWVNAATWNQTAFGVVDQKGGNRIRPYIVRNQARIAEGQGHPEEAVRACRDLLADSQTNQILRWEAYALLANIDAGSRNFSQANQEFAGALAAIDSARSLLENPQNRITLLSRLIPFYKQYVDSLVEQNDDPKALTVIESSRARVLAESLRRDSKPMVFDAAALQRLAQTTGSLLLSFWLAPERSYAWLITPREVRRFSLPPASEIESLIAAWRNSVEHSWGDPIAASDATGARLWSVLLGDIAPRIPRGSRLIVVPDGMLHRLNLETLPVPGPAPHYWVEDVDLAVAPSMTLLASAEKPRLAAPPSLLLMGAPVPIPQYDKLPQAEAEITDIQNHFPQASKAVFTGATATLAAYRQVDPAQFSLIHFAAHAEPNPESPLESAIVLSPVEGQYLLKARDIIGTPLSARLVTISACRSAGARIYAGEGLIGLAWAFLEAGSSAVVAGLWDVNDGSSRLLMDRLYAGIAAGQSPAMALHQAKLAMLQGEPRFRRPYFWAPFQVYVRSAPWNR
ncbi:MAG: CHAT domain-containing protein [Candidatus Sulfopaludibacter sp.]|nr:CHAT domain-containing protein [Candidatus Sulfopaludibacter sp.]